jgi:hypothetical protein
MAEADFDIETTLKKRLDEVKTKRDKDQVSTFVVY